MAQSRATAARIMTYVMNGHSLSDSLPKGLATLREIRDRAFVQALCYGVCRYFSRLDVLLKVYLEKPLKNADIDIKALLLIGLYQLTDMRVAPHAAVSETVQATEVLGKPWARGLVNAVLRRHQREAEKLAITDPVYVYAHPNWWIKKIRDAYPSEWQSILAANNEHPPFALRVNQQKVARETYQANLAVPNALLPFTEAGIVLEEAMPVEDLPGFADGEISVQDGAAQLSAALLQLSPHLRVLDACAAPGGKLCHLLEHENSVQAVALDRDADRLTSIEENLARLSLSAKLLAKDAADVSSWWDGKPFDRILLDAPCSASGVIRRHPDIKLLRKPDDIAPLVQEQTRLLNALWQVLAPGGLLVYATCSIFPQENTEIVQAFLAQHKEDAIDVPIDADWGIPQAVGRQILPGMHGFDGFYYARLRKLK